MCRRHTAIFGEAEHHFAAYAANHHYAEGITSFAKQSSLREAACRKAHRQIRRMPDIIQKAVRGRSFCFFAIYSLSPAAQADPSLRSARRVRGSKERRRRYICKLTFPFYSKKFSRYILPTCRRARPNVTASRGRVHRIEQIPTKNERRRTIVRQSSFSLKRLFYAKRVNERTRLCLLNWHSLVENII